MIAIAAFVGRLFLAVLFIHSGIGKLIAPEGAAAMLAGAGLSPSLAQPTGIFELVAGLALVFGFMTRLFAILLAAFVLLTTLMFHNQLTDPMQVVQAEKNLAIAGGLLALFAASQMRWSYDSMRLRRRGEVATHDAEVRIHEAELRAARAEGRVDGVHDTPVAGRATATDLNRDGVPDVHHRKRWFWQR
jgi:putative oxidoreductase